TICADDINNLTKALSTLTGVQLSASNYFFNAVNMKKLVALIGAQWKGALPFTLLIEPGGNYIYGKQGGIQPLFIKKKIVDHPLTGRYF
ncbi:MAG: redoxin, partial [Ferruginibacter sp.]